MMVIEKARPLGRPSKKLLQLQHLLQLRLHHRRPVLQRLLQLRVHRLNAHEVLDFLVDHDHVLGPRCLRLAHIHRRGQRLDAAQALFQLRRRQKNFEPGPRDEGVQVLKEAPDASTLGDKCGAVSTTGCG